MTKQIDLASLSGDCVGVHWKSLQDLLPIYRAITTTTIGDGRRTSFWLDHWLPTGQLADTFPALFTHAKELDASVAKVCSQPLRGHFAYRLSHIATAKLAMLEEIVEEVVLQDMPDCRKCPLAEKDGTLRAGLIYRARMSLQENTPCPFYKFVWSNCAPPRVRFFAWLLVQEKIQCKTNLRFKNVVDDAECEVCRVAVESPDHLILHCTIATQFWAKLGISVHQASVSQLWKLDRPQACRLNTTPPFCYCVPGNFGSIGTMLSLEARSHPSYVCYSVAKKKHAFGHTDCRDKTNKLPMPGVMCFVPTCKP